jgi:hypothetical protein
MRYLFYLYVISIFIPAKLEIVGLVLTPSRLILGSLILLSIPKIIIAYQKRGLFSRLRPRRFVIPLVILFLYSLVLLSIRPYRHRMMIDTLETVLVIASFIVTFGSETLFGLTKKDATNIFYLLLLLSIVGTLRIVYGYLTATEYAEFRQYRLRTIGSPLFALISSYLLFHSERSPLPLAVLIVSTLAVAMLQTRGTWIIAALVFVLAVTRYGSDVASPVNTVLFLQLVLLVAFLSMLFRFNLLPSDIIARVRSIFAGTQNFTERFVNWRMSTRMFAAYPLGTGLGTWRFYAPRFDLYPSYLGRSLPRGLLSPHSDWFTFLAEAGLVGVVCLAWLWLQIARTVFFRYARSVEGMTLWCYLLGLLIASFKGDMLLNGGGIVLPVYIYLFLIVERIGEPSRVESNVRKEKPTNE